MNDKMSKAEELFSRHHRDIYRYLAHMTGRKDVAEDLSQDVFVKIVGALKNGGMVGHERGWVFSIARNLLVDRYHAERRLPPEINAEEPAMESIQGLAFDLRQSLDRLPAADREVFLMKEVGGLTYQEIALVCESSVESVRSRLRRARIALRELMNPRHPAKLGTKL